MHPILFKIGPFTFYSYGLMVAVGFGLATMLLCRRGPKFNFPQELMLDLAVIILISGIIGARALYILLNIEYYLTSPMEMLNLTKGGLVWYGGLLSGFAAMSIFARINKINVWLLADLLAPYIALGQAFGRIGCFLNGCCFGKYGLPVQLYSSFLLFGIFFILLKWQDRDHFGGEIFLGYLMLYPLKRFFIEFIRADNPRIILSLTLSQIISVFIFSIALVIFIHKALKWKKSHSA